MIQISAALAVTLVLAFLGMVFGFGRVLLSQFEKRMAERFKATDRVHSTEILGMRQQLQTDSSRLSVLIEEVKKLDRILPLEYVRREDWIRFSSAIDHKLDRLAELVMNIPGGNRARD